MPKKIMSVPLDFPASRNVRNTSLSFIKLPSLWYFVKIIMSVFMPVPYCFDYCIFINLEVLYASCIVFLLKITLAIYSHSNLQLFFFFCKEGHCSFDRDCIDHHGWYGHLNSISSCNSCTCDIFSFICVFLNFLHQ